MTSEEQIADEDLVALAQRAAEGDTRPFEALVRRHERKVLTNCRYLSGSAADAEDLAQEVFVKAFFGLARFEGRASFRTWLLRIKANHCINFSKKRRQDVVGVDPETLDSVASEPPRAERELEKEAVRDEVGAVLLQLTETLRVPLILRDMDGMSYQEIADELDVGLSAVKMRIKRGRQEFRQLYSAARATEGGP